MLLEDWILRHGCIDGVLLAARSEIIIWLQMQELGIQDRPAHGLKPCYTSSAAGSTAESRFDNAVEL